MASLSPQNKHAPNRARYSKVFAQPYTNCPRTPRKSNSCSPTPRAQIYHRIRLPPSLTPEKEG